ncbi:molybdenum cofactor guanylyltransferase [Phytoactinopolyspora endophytica]|uniref:molybdenum cofactor guanylyltransferase n=1 Tax=Phytoactinopolyspora endophytica TaxID=1642495 RepID=UPI00197C0AE3|nr:NTP transferase domain-containing protein [Phytoactinopolyspora endophytica]
MTDSGAVILAGGAGRRLGGVDKPSLVVHGRTLLDTALDACSGCSDIVVVGARRTTGREVRWTVEEPSGGGPLAGLAAGLRELPRSVEVVTVLAADLPSVTHKAVEALQRALAEAEADAVLLTDVNGRQQPLTAVYDRLALEAALQAVGDPSGHAFRTLLPHMRVATLAHPSAAEDIDTPADLARWSIDSRERKDDE